MEPEKSKWSKVKHEFNHRVNSPLKHPEFILYFFFVIVFGFALGVVPTILVELSMKEQNPSHHISNTHIILSITAYFIALLSASAVDLILSSKSGDAESKIPSRKSWIMIGIGSLIIGFAAMALSLLTAEVCFIGYLFAAVGLALSWLIWWITNSENPNLTEDEPNNPASPLGDSMGTVYPATAPLQGNLKGIKSS